MITTLSILGLGAVGWGLIAALLGLALPVFWVWMLIDALLRDEACYPAHFQRVNTKVVWVLLIAFFQAAAIAYFALVYLQARRTPVPA